jgi:phage shock protein C
MTSQVKRLYRSRDEQMLAGVCGGVAEYFDVDPTLIRLLFVLLALAGGPGLLAYLILWIVIPERPAGDVL